jgi:hypothetical protein
MNTLLYGPPKVGKSTGAASAPGPVLYLNGDTPNAVRFAHAKFGNAIREVRVKGLQTLVDATAAIKAGDFASVVIDPISDVYRVLLEDMSNRALSPSLPTYKDVGTHLERFCRMLCEEPVNAVLVCHDVPVQDESTDEIERLPYTGTNKTTLGQKLMGMVDVVGYCGVKVEGEGDDQAVRYMAQLINGGGRRGGTRFDVLGTAREVDLSEWSKLATDAPKPVQEEAKAA